MKKTITLITIASTAALQIAWSSLHINGIAGYTNSPGEATCTNCHVTYPLNSHTGGIVIALNSSANFTYLPGQTYIVSVTVTKAGATLFGFDFEALDNTGADAGTLSLIDPSTTILINALVNGNNRTNVTHYGGVLVNDSCTISFNWAAPSTNSGDITFYAAGNAANNDGVSFGDYIYTTSQIISPTINTTIIENKKNLSYFQLFNNPTQDNFSVSYTLPEDYKTVKAELYSINGKLVTSLFSQSEMKGNYQKTLSIPSSFSRGIYFVKLITDNKLLGAKKLVVY